MTEAASAHPQEAGHRSSDACSDDAAASAGSDGRPTSTRESDLSTAARRSGLAALSLGALGVVFGDIGTSPLYALNAVFTTDGLRPDRPGVYGVISLVFWAVTIVVSVKYVTFVMRVDNEGEGGTIALLSLVERMVRKRRLTILIALGTLGAALFYGDGMITPAISVLSAVEGLEVAAPPLKELIVPVALVVLALLFGVQRFGTGAVGRLFGPIMLLWFGVLAATGLAKVLGSPAILAALSPAYAVDFFLRDGATAFFALGGVVLALTGAEALYADMGHFGRAPISRAWFFVVFPALMLNYMGQGALILESPHAVSRPFFLLVPAWGRIPAVLLATVATVIASQAVISGAFSITRQAMQLRLVPRLNFRHTSGTRIGQVYGPAVNGILFAGVVALVIGFGSSSRLAGAYGIAVTGTMVITTVLFLVVIRSIQRKPVWVVVAGCVTFLVVDLALFGANLPKILDGGWFPITVAILLFAVLTTWRRGVEILSPHRARQEGSLAEFVEEVRALDPPIYRPPGTAIFLHAGKETTPLALRENVDHNHVLHESVVIVSTEIVGRAHVPGGECLVLDDLGHEDDGISHVTARFGYRDEPNVPSALRLPAIAQLEREVDLDNATYFLSKMTIVPTDAPGMSRWRKRLFVAVSYASASPADFFGLPEDRLVTVGSHIEL